MEPRIQYARTEDGVSIAYSTVGTGPPIVLTAIMWGDASQEGYSGLPSVSQITALTEAGLQVTSYDPRGTGGSDRTRPRRVDVPMAWVKRRLGGRPSVTLTPFWWLLYFSQVVGLPAEGSLISERQVDRVLRELNGRKIGTTPFH